LFLGGRGLEQWSAMGSPIAADAALTATAAIDGLMEARERTLALVASLDGDTLERVHSPLMSPLVWDLGHIAAFEDLWLVHRHGGRPLLREDLAEVYDAFETPRAGRGGLPFLRSGEARSYLDEVRERALETIEREGIGDGFIHEMVIRHEHQHCETMLQTIQLGRIAPYAPYGRAHADGTGGGLTGLELVEVPAGPCTIGAAPDGFAYDNERGRHEANPGGFQIGRAPVTNATYLRFVEGGGYVRREWWSDEGWAWKEQYDITRPGAWSEDLRSEWRLGELVPLHPDQPVVHVSWFEAEAFARAHGARLPTEIEWEKAATWDQRRGTARRFPWGEEPPVPGRHANLDHHAAGPLPAGACPEGASPYGCVAMLGDVWEWMADEFGAYPGFAAHPYPEYSEVFFGQGYRVLRGGSWATRARVATPTFRNWDYPMRRQIFAGFRIARDL
jgi:iron(II)-dependent oxidoreductase